MRGPGRIFKGLEDVAQAAGIWIRNKLGVTTHANEKLKEQMDAIPYQQKFDRQPVDAFGPIKA